MRLTAAAAADMTVANDIKEAENTESSNRR